MNMTDTLVAFLLICGVILLLLFFFISQSFAASDGTVTVDLNATNVWWNDSVLVSGTATYSNGTSISDAGVEIFVDDELSCSTTTLPNGDYNCSFYSPFELGTYTVLVNVTNSTGYNFVNSSSLIVRLKYGKVPSGKADRVVYEIPVIIQELSGSIRRAWVRIMVW